MIAGVLLAAGLSRRMGQAKLLLPLGGRPVLRHSAERLLAAGLAPVIVVTGEEQGSAAAALAGLAVELVANPNAAAGQSTSVRAGIVALPPGAEAALIALGDQPFLPEDVIPRLCDALRSMNKPIAAPRYRDGIGNPVLFGAAVFPELLALDGDRGARSVVERDLGRVALVDFDLPMPQDLDTPEDYDRLRSRGEPV